jgi:hypothetical protein
MSSTRRRTLPNLSPAERALAPYDPNDIIRSLRGLGRPTQARMPVASNDELLTIEELGASTAAELHIVYHHDQAVIWPLHTKPTRDDA